jgi:hypothetical protein
MFFIAGCGMKDMMSHLGLGGERAFVGGWGRVWCGEVSLGVFFK